MVYGHLRTEDAVTRADGVWVSFTVIVLLYTVVGAATVATLRAMSRRWRRDDETPDDAVPYGPRPAVPPDAGRAAAR
nr:hypothetical protein GCM10020092_065130 [Actinoplanes digitatis]